MIEMEFKTDIERDNIIKEMQDKGYFLVNITQLTCKKTLGFDTQPLPEIVPEPSIEDRVSALEDTILNLI